MRACRPTGGGAPSRLDASPRSHRSWSLTNNHHNCISLGRAMGLWVIAVGVRPTIFTTAIHKSPKRYRICCASTNITQLCVLHTLPPSPKKGDSASMSPDMPSSGKRPQLTGPCSSHLCRTRVPVVFLFQHRRADHHGEPALHVDGSSLRLRDPQGKDNPT